MRRLLDGAISRLSSLRARQVRKPAQVVLWGGRERDYQLGSPQDRARAARLAQMAAMARSLEAMATSIGRALLPSMQKTVRALETMGVAMNRAAISQDEAARRIGASVAMLGRSRKGGNRRPQ